MKKVSVLFFSLLFLFVFCSCSDATDDYQTPAGAAAQQETEAFIKATGLVLDQDSITLKSGQKKQLKAEVYPSNASDKTLIWRSSDEKVATVQGGTVTAVGNGTTKIIVSAGDELVQTCTVLVSTPAERILVKGSNSGAEVSKLNLEVNTSHKLYATVLPESASEKSVSWESSNQSVATVTNDGVVIAVKNGEADIIAKHVDGISSVCHVTVRTEVKEIKLDRETLNFYTTDLSIYSREKKLNYTILPETASDQNVKWESSDSSIATVDNTGLVKTSTKVGTAIITVCSSNGKKASCSVTVAIIVSDIVFYIDGEKVTTGSINLTIGKTIKIETKVFPENATNKEVFWKSEDSTIAKIDESGLLTGVKKGEAIIEATSRDGARTRRLNIIVERERITENCPVCQGTGKEEIRCSVCGGWGYYFKCAICGQTRQPVTYCSCGSILKTVVNCNNCTDGVAYERDCSNCHGTGTITKTKE